VTDTQRTSTYMGTTAYLWRMVGIRRPSWSLVIWFVNQYISKITCIYTVHYTLQSTWRSL